MLLGYAFWGLYIINNIKLSFQFYEPRFQPLTEQQLIAVECVPAAKELRKPRGSRVRQIAQIGQLPNANYLALIHSVGALPIEFIQGENRKQREHPIPVHDFLRLSNKARPMTLQQINQFILKNKNIMLSRVSSRLASQKAFQPFSVRKFFFDFVQRDDTSSEHFQVASQDPRVPLRTQGSAITENERHYEVSKLKNGITILTESASAPSRVDIGVLLDVGTRDETSETSGSLLSIKNTYYKTVLNTNETVNYGVIQMSGGDFEMDYDQESTYFRAHCLAHDVVDVFKIVSDCALEPRSVVAANVALEKNQGVHNLEKVVHSGETFNETIFKTAFGTTGLGMPLRGAKGNIGNLSAYTLQKFQLENIHPSRITICGAGVYDHQEFHQLAQQTLDFIPESNKTVTRAQSQYLGGEVRNLTDDSEIAIALLFPTVNWSHQNLAVYQVLNAILGLQGTSNSRLQRNILAKHSFADTAESVNFNFSDAGLLGVKVTGSADKGAELLQLAIGELKSLAGPIKNDELQRAKNILKTNIYLALERTADRLEEAAKNLRSFNEIRLSQYGALIDGVTTAQLNKAVADLLASKPTLVAEGGQANRLPSYDQILNQLK